MAKSHNPKRTAATFRVRSNDARTIRELQTFLVDLAPKDEAMPDIRRPLSDDGAGPSNAGLAAGSVEAPVTDMTLALPPLKEREPTPEPESGTEESSEDEGYEVKKGKVVNKLLVKLVATSTATNLTQAEATKAVALNSREAIQLNEAKSKQVEAAVAETVAVRNAHNSTTATYQTLQMAACSLASAAVGAGPDGGLKLFNLVTGVSCEFVDLGPRGRLLGATTTLFSMEDAWAFVMGILYGLADAFRGKESLLSDLLMGGAGRG